MKAVFNTARSYLCSSLSFLAALFGRRDKVVGHSSGGYAMLAGWNFSPEDAVVAEWRRSFGEQKPPPRAALYCYGGAHEGEVLLLKNDIEDIGCCVQNSVVVTPFGAKGDASYQLALNSVGKMTAKLGSTFCVNGREVRESELYDYDRVDLLGNRFVFLDLQAIGLLEGSEEVKE